MFLATCTQGLGTNTQNLATTTQRQATNQGPPNPIPTTTNQGPLPNLATCMPCSEPIPTTKATKTSDAPHVLVNYKSLQAIVDANLRPCLKCKQSTLRLVQKKRTNFAVTLELVCDDCVNAENKLQKEVNYLSAKLSNLTIDNLEEAKVKKALKRKLANKRKQLTSCANNEPRTIRHSRNSRFVNNKKKGREPALSYDLNIRAMLMAFYCGTGGVRYWIICIFYGNIWRWILGTYIS